MTVPCLISESSPHWIRIQKPTDQGRLKLLQRNGGYLITPRGHRALEPIPGIRVVHPDIPPGASQERIAQAISAEAQRMTAQKSPSLVHSLDIQAASAALIGGRGRIPVIIEPDPHQPS